MNKFNEPSRWLAGFACLLTMAFCATASAQQYPNRPVNIIVPFPAGAGSDLFTRTLAVELGAALGQPVIVQNKPGGNTAIGVGAVTSAPPDGYTLLMATASTVALPAMNKGLPFNIRTDLTPIAQLTDFVLYLYSNAELPVKTFPELVAYGKANPGKLNYATGNATGVVSSVQLASMAKLDMVGVPYKGEPAAVTDLIANRIQVMFSSPSSAESFARQGKLNVLATTLPQRSPYAPGVPTVKEYLPNFNTSGWGGLMGPANLPQPIVNRLAAEMKKILQKPEVQKKLENMQMIAHYATPEQFAAFYSEQAELYSRVLREAGVVPE